MPAMQKQMKQRAREQQQIRQQAKEMGPMFGQQEKPRDRQKGAEHDPGTS
jgi:hypothetical protein